jgi:hypothetical protein
LINGLRVLPGRRDRGRGVATYAVRLQLRHLNGVPSAPHFTDRASRFTDRAERQYPANYAGDHQAPPRDGGSFFAVRRGEICRMPPPFFGLHDDDHPAVANASKSFKAQCEGEFRTPDIAQELAQGHRWGLML